MSIRFHATLPDSISRSSTVSYQPRRQQLRQMTVIANLGAMLTLFLGSLGLLFPKRICRLLGINPDGGMIAASTKQPSIEGEVSVRNVSKNSNSHTPLTSAYGYHIGPSGLKSVTKTTSSFSRKIDLISEVFRSKKRAVPSSSRVNTDLPSRLNF